VHRLPAPLAAAASLLAGAALAACQHPPQAIAAVAVAAGHEDGASAYTISPDGAWALLDGGSGTTLVNLATGHIDTTVSAGADLAVLRTRVGPADTAWSALEPPPPAVPAGATWRRSPDGHRLAFFRPGQDTVFVGPADTLQAYALDGAVTGAGWVPRGDLLYVLVLHPDGLSALDRINLETGAVQPMRQQLDAPPRGNTVAVSADAGTLYLAFLSGTVAAPGERQERQEGQEGQRAGADRDTDIYALDLRSGRLQRVAGTPGEDVGPVVVGQALYWTQSDPAGHRKVLWRLPL